MMPDDLSTRRPVWLALSDLYLDTDTSRWYPQIAAVLADSGYPLEQLRQILLHEVHPAVRANLFAVAGVWTGFDEDWLVERILRRHARPRWRRLFGCVFCADPQAHWSRLLPLIVAARAQQAGTR